MVMSQPLSEERRVVPFAAPSGRMRRRIVEDTSTKGAILLFTGVRYQRMVETAPLARDVAALSEPQRSN